jgi:hypothetical protein
VRDAAQGTKKRAKGKSRKSGKSQPKKYSVHGSARVTGVFDVHDNGGRPFRVVLEPGKAKVFRTVETLEDGGMQVEPKGAAIWSGAYQHVWIGDDYLVLDKNRKTNGLFPGNSILLRVGAKRYVYVGHVVVSFEAEDEIEAFYSPVVGSDVPYPYAVGAKFVYFMLDHKKVPVDEVKLDEDAYNQFYGHKPYARALKDVAKGYKVKTIHGRAY